MRKTMEESDEHLYISLREEGLRFVCTEFVCAVFPLSSKVAQSAMHVVSSGTLVYRFMPDVPQSYPIY